MAVRRANNIGYTEPLSGIVSMWPDGRIKIDGAKTGWLFGVTPKDAGYPKYHDGRRCHPVIQSTDIAFSYT